MTDRQKKQWVAMAELTAPLCAGEGKGACRVPHSCCDPMYCRMAIERAEELGEELVPVDIDAKLPLMGPTGCVAPPHLRPLCTLHFCCINGMGFNAEDMAWTEKYFKLRDKLEKTL